MSRPTDVAYRGGILDKIRSFMGGAQLEIYDDVRDFLQTQEANISYVDGAAGEKLRAALLDPDCYKGTAIQSLKSDLYALKDKVELDVLKERKAVVTAVDECASKVAQTAEFRALTPDPGNMVLAHQRCQPPGPAPMQIAKAAVAIAVRMNGAVFLPQQGQRYARALELPVDRRPIRLRLDKPVGATDRMKQQRFQCGVRHLRSKRPSERGPFNPLQIFAGRALPDAEARRNLPSR